jgi:hypothetical protein
MLKITKDKMRTVRISSEHIKLLEKQGMKLQAYLDEKLKKDFGDLAKKSK